MRVLLTNDDGADAPWLSRMAAALTGAGHRVSVIAPDGNRSGTSGSLAPLPFGRPVDVRLERVARIEAVEAWAAVDCSPTVCVLLGLGGFLEERPELVVSGPNNGWNLGRDVWRSGTAWAAITAWGMGVPALAVSASPAPHASDDVEELTDHTARVLKELADSPEPEVWNLNFPAPPAGSWAPMRWAPMAAHERLSSTDLDIVARSAEGDAVVRMGQHPDLEVLGAPGTDAAVVQGGGVALSRLRPLDAVEAPSS